MLQPVQGRLAGQRGAIGAFGLQLARHCRQHRIEAQLVVVDQVLVPQRDGNHTLADQRRQRMFHQVGSPVIRKASRKPLDHADRLVGRPQQQRARIRGNLTAVKRRLHSATLDASKIEPPGTTLCRHRDLRQDGSSRSRKTTFTTQRPRCTYHP